MGAPQTLGIPDDFPEAVEDRRGGIVSSSFPLPGKTSPKGASTDKVNELVMLGELGEDVQLSQNSIF